MCNGSGYIVPDITLEEGFEKPPSSVGFQELEFHESTLAAQVTACVKATYDNGKICVTLLKESFCFKVSLPIPTGTEVKVCMQTCGFRIHFPPFDGIKGTVYLDKKDLWSGVIWGSC